MKWSLFGTQESLAAHRGVSMGDDRCWLEGLVPLPVSASPLLWARTAGPKGPVGGQKASARLARF